MASKTNKKVKIGARKGGQQLAMTRVNTVKRTKKASQEEIAERRRMVLRMRMRGVGYREIAKKLGVGHMTIKRDLEIIQAKTRERIGKFEREYALSESLSVYEEVETAAWNDYHSSTPGSSTRASFLAQIRAARGDQVKLLMDVGLIDRAAQEVKHKHEHSNAQVIANWSPAAQDLVALAIVKAGLKPLPDPTPDDENVIEAKALPAATEKKKGGNNVPSTGTDG
jgi:hypothetical protein